MNAMLGDLPTWNLSDLYSSPGGPDLDADLKRAAADADSFAKAYEGKVAGAGRKGAGWRGRRIRGAERPDGPHRLLRLTLLRAGHGRSRARPFLAGRFPGADRRRRRAGVLHGWRSTSSTTPTWPPSRRIPRWPSTARGCATSRFTVRTSSPTRWRRRCTRSTSSAAPPGRACSTRPSRGLRYPFRNEVLTEPQILDKLSSKDAARAQGRRQVVRQGAGRQYRGLLAGHQHARQGQGDRGPLAQVSRARNRRCNLANVVEDEVVDALASSVKAAYPRLAHRYYKLKAKWFGVDTHAVLGSQRAAARARRPHHPVERGGEDRARRLPRLLARAGRCRPEVLRHRLDRCAGAARQVAAAPSPIPPCRRRTRICC